MKPLLPLACAVAAFFIARHFRPAGTLTTPTPPVFEASMSRDVPRGLERRARRLADLEAGSPAALERLYRSGNHSDWELLAVVRRSAESDPEGTWQWIEEQSLNTNDRRLFRQTVALAWFPQDPVGLLSRLNPTDYNDWQIAGNLIGLLASDDPASAAAARNHLDEIVAAGALRLGSSGLPLSGEQGGEILLALPPGPSRDLLVQQYAIDWLARDASAAQAWMANLSPAQRNKVMAEFSPQAIRRQGAAGALAASWIRNEAPPALKAKLGPDLVDWMLDEYPQAGSKPAFSWATENLSAAPLATAMGKLVARHFSSEPDHARQMVEELPSGNLRHQAAMDVANFWAASDPESAVNWWLGTVDPAEAAKSGYSSPAYQLGLEWFGSDPDSIRARLADPEQPPLPMSLATPALREWMKAQPAATLEWVDTLPAERRGSFTELALRELSWQDPAAAAGLFDQRSGTAPPSAAGSIAGSWYRRDQDAAIQWAGTLPPGPARDAALAKLKSAADFDVQLGATFPDDLRKILE
ncbi:hypothetical protein [Luteolibacter marinus]|uniref:hypothetical protein n=1 Tax=Luteolibacter marinus TaxID=2776705 RepID=UPI001867598A|nr:hypothetical protein [Luteolibacter marinus]